MEEKLMTDDERIAEEVVVDGLTFVPFLKRDEIRRQVKRVASELRRDLEGKRPLFICVLNGAFIFAADLIRECGINDCSVTFVRYKSYEGMSTTGNVKQLVGLTEDLTGCCHYRGYRRHRSDGKADDSRYQETGSGIGEICHSTP